MRLWAHGWAKRPFAWSIITVIGGLALTAIVLVVRARIHHAHVLARKQRAQAIADKAARQKQTELYVSAIKPLLRQRCYRCHGATRQSGGVRLDSVAAMNRGGKSGPILVAGKPNESLLIRALQGSDGVSQMPQDERPLTNGEIASVASWIQSGAPAPPQEKEDSPSRHWAFQPVEAQQVPADRTHRVSNPIDAFVFETHARQGIKSVVPADRLILLRRAYLDLVGLPPTFQEIEQFEADKSADAYERVVERLLASPRYGERWGRHLMDIWRYSDTDGRKSSNQVWWSDPLIWRWRDWIVQSLNRDKGYDRMILEMLAGDELPDATPESLIATGFLVRNRFSLDRNIWLSNTVEHTAKAFLGLTINCARCHNHKFDPITQQEYYEFRRFFEAVDAETVEIPQPGRKVKLSLVRIVDSRPNDPTFLFIRGQPAAPDKSVSIRCGVPEVLGRVAPLAEIKPAAGSTGRRLALAKWLVDRRNPMTARVAVNHVWLRHFGQPLIESVYDFGTRTKSGPEAKLLDWLADDFQSHGFSLKRLHRLMMTSSVYRLSSSTRTANPVASRVDPDNRLFWHMNTRRMEGEVVRDALLSIGGDLDSSMGGPSLALAEAAKSCRRSLYFRYSREGKLPMLALFDSASVDDCYCRTVSIVPHQAMTLMNDPFVLHESRRLVQRISARKTPHGAEPDFVRCAFRAILGRDETGSERQACDEFLGRSSGQERTPQIQPVSAQLPQSASFRGPSNDFDLKLQLVHALLNHNDFVTVR